MLCSIGICVFIADNKIEFCETPFPCKIPEIGCQESTEGTCEYLVTKLFCISGNYLHISPLMAVCTGNAELESCDPMTGCKCKRGYLGPDCCKCDTEGVENGGQTFFQSEDQCLRKSVCVIL